VSSDAAFLRRTRGVGVTSREQAEALGVTGPVARAAGVPRDLRVDAPYAGYAQFPVQIMLGESGDLESRTIVRLKELLESIRLIRLILANLPEGDLTTRMPRKVKAGEIISRVEAPRGELFYYIRSGGGEMPERIKVRTPTLANMASLTVLSVGHQLADMPMLLAGIDPCFSGKATERYGSPGHTDPNGGHA
jgi:NADH-quinone oxidoreductase subunit D